MKSWHIILIAAVGTSLIAVAPAPDKAGEPDETETASEPAQVMPAQEKKVESTADTAKLLPASFDGNTSKLKKAN